MVQIVLALVLAIGLVLWSLRDARTALVCLLFLLILSNPLIALFSPLIEATAFRAFLAVDFVYAGLLVGFLLLHQLMRRQRGLVTKELLLGVALCALLLAYYLLGIIQNGFENATIYLRMFLSPLLLYCIGRWVGRTVRYDDAVRTFQVFAVVVCVLLFFEVAFTRAYHMALNSESYFALKDGRGFFNVEELIWHRQRRLLNLKFLEELVVYRPSGATFNYPSTSYLLCFGLALAAGYRRAFLAALLLVGLALIGTKAAAAFVLWLACFRLVRRLPARLGNAGRVLFVTGYVFATLAILYWGQSVHAYSLLASLIQLPSHPLGRGLGFGGSVGTERVYSFDSDMLIGDSALAIAINMMGLVGLLLLMIYGRGVAQAMRRAVVGRDLALYTLAVFGLFAVANMVVQELAIGPYGIGLFLLFLAIHQSNRRHSATMP